MRFDYRPPERLTYFDKFEVKLKVRKKEDSASEYLAKMSVASVATGYVIRKIVINNEIKKLSNPTKEIVDNLIKTQHKAMPLWACSMLSFGLIVGVLKILQCISDRFDELTNYLKNRKS